MEGGLDPLGARQGVGGAELSFEKTSFLFWNRIRGRELKGRAEQAGGAPWAPTQAASLSGAVPSPRRSQQWKIHTPAANKQMVSSLMEDHLKTPGSAFLGSDTTAFWSYCFSEKN